MVSFLKRPSFVLLALTAAGALALPGCTDIKRGLGMEKVVPDEFAVTATAPLAVPPDFTLRPPQPGAPPTQVSAPVDQARHTVFRVGDTKLETLQPATGSFSPGEGALLKQAGAPNAPSNIRQLVNAEDQPVQDNASFADKLLFWKSTPSAAPADQVIDPGFEADRLRASAAGGTAAASATRSAAAGTGATGTPVIERTKETHFWNSLF